ncbi:MAG: OmpA family protein [Desulfarculaceae bacterium]|nr:OmpA family protein [Desulfarculaceae bacterium]MCF8047247.1 OmpA family protein [Desulfarculaceae bacterium]MCF8065072.1 OmpA family protein [Desulfarculaceae bacterium]MCF8097808.1 OmpA family protein [Desulfarculaceae bacterium]MCF8122335.1 OmpA family protein [Desulfarculaceae bacterium]
MPKLRACPGCGGDESRRSRRRGVWEQLLGQLGILPYVCKTCRRRFLASKGGAAAWTIGLVFLLILVTAGVWWFYDGGKPPVYQPNLHNTPVKAQPGDRELQFRGDIKALAGSLEEIRREKAALLAELSVLRDQLKKNIKAANTKPPQAAPPAARSLLGKVSFSSGSAELDAKGRQTLEAIAARLAQTPGARLLVEGSADSAPMGARTAARYGDNAGLAFARALSVFRALRRSGVEQERMNMSASGRADSGKDDGRTVEIWRVPAS